MNAESIKISIYKMDIDKLKDISEREFKDMCEIVAINYGEGINFGNLCPIVIDCMRQLKKKKPYTSGQNKKKIVLKMVEYIIYEVSPNLHDNFINLIKEHVPNIIDVVCAKPSKLLNYPKGFCKTYCCFLTCWCTLFNNIIHCRCFRCCKCCR
tara:strand:+ start:564 stop:1022 length:459 start_codon:yes stop_codon:yes gene_type:complete